MTIRMSEVEAGAPEDAPELLASAEWQLALRIAHGATLARSDLLKRFLLYICDRKLRGCETEITEYQIGVQALGRPPTYDPTEDNIVRNYARILRKRLEEHFAGEGRHEELRIVIPRGRYIPVFAANDAVAAAGPALEAAISESAPPQHKESASSSEARRPATRKRSTSLILLCGSTAALLLTALSLTPWYLHRVAPVKLYDRFWTELFDPAHPAFVIAGDSGFAMLQEMTGREVHLHDYVTGDLQARFPALTLATSQVGAYSVDRFSNYTSVADLSAILGFSALPEFTAAHVKVRYARDMRMQDLKQANLILLGGRHANPWVELFEPESQFGMQFPLTLAGLHLDERIIINKHPRTGEQATYANTPSVEPHVTYTVVSFLPNGDHDTHALLLQGQNMAGTQAGADFVLDRNAMAPVLRKALLKDGSIGPFELILQTTTVGANAPGASLVVERYGHNP